MRTLFYLEKRKLDKTKIVSWFLDMCRENPVAERITREIREISSRVHFYDIYRIISVIKK